MRQDRDPRPHSTSISSSLYLHIRQLFPISLNLPNFPLTLYFKQNKTILNVFLDTTGTNSVAVSMGQIWIYKCFLTTRQHGVLFSLRIFPTFSVSEWRTGNGLNDHISIHSDFIIMLIHFSRITFYNIRLKHDFWYEHLTYLCSRWEQEMIWGQTIKKPVYYFSSIHSLTSKRTNHSQIIFILYSIWYKTKFCDSDMPFKDIRTRK